MSANSFNLTVNSFVQGQSCGNQADLHCWGGFLLLSSDFQADPAMKRRSQPPQCHVGAPPAVGWGWEGGAKLGVAFFRLPCSCNERFQLPEGHIHSSSPAPPLQTALARGRTRVSFVWSYFQHGLTLWV